MVLWFFCGVIFCIFWCCLGLVLVFLVVVVREIDVRRGMMDVGDCVGSVCGGFLGVSRIYVVESGLEVSFG